MVHGEPFGAISNKNYVRNCKGVLSLVFGFPACSGDEKGEGKGVKDKEDKAGRKEYNNQEVKKGRQGRKKE